MLGPETFGMTVICSVVFRNVVSVHVLSVLVSLFICLFVCLAACICICLLAHELRAVQHPLNSGSVSVAHCVLCVTGYGVCLSAVQTDY